MSKKKILWISILVIFIIVVILLAIKLSPRDTSNDNSISTKQISNTSSDTNTVKAEETSYTKITLDDGVLYSVTGEEITSDIIIETDYYDTTINDLYLNPSSYQGKNIEIEGLYLTSDIYTFVGRYSANSTCQYCSGGLSYIEYEFGGNVEEELVDQETWIKLIGTWESATYNYGTEEEPYYYEYYYLKVLNLEIMNEKGEDTVTN